MTYYFLSFQEGGRCYGLFYQGPCKVGEIFEPRDRYTSLGKCIIKKEIAIVNLNFGTITYHKPQKQEEEAKNEKLNHSSENKEYKDDKRPQIFQGKQETSDNTRRQKERGQ